MDGIKATTVLRKEFPNMGIIALSMFDDEMHIVDMLEAGANGYLIKNAKKEELLIAIQCAAGLTPYYCAHTSLKLAQLIARSRYDPIKKKNNLIFQKERLK